MNTVFVRLRFFLMVLASVIIVGTLGFMAVEGLEFGDALYFTVVTVATVGYGDIVPTSSVGKALSLVLILLGVGTFLGVVANTAEMFLVRRELEMRKEKLAMVVGVFFSEVGTELLRFCTLHDRDIDQIREKLVVRDSWAEKDFVLARKSLRGRVFAADVSREDLLALRNVLQEKAELFLRLFENPNLLEHESFSELLRAILHLKEELLHRVDLAGVPEKDHEHLSGDLRRVYSLLVAEWVEYMRHLKVRYPYLFSLAVRLNPFDRASSPVLTP